MHQMQIVFNKAYVSVDSLVIGLKIATIGTLQQTVVRLSCEHSKKQDFVASFVWGCWEKKEFIVCLFEGNEES